MRIQDEKFGQQIQRFAVAGLAAEATAAVTYSLKTVQLSDGEEVVMHQPEYSIQSKTGQDLSHINFSPRIAPSLAGLGLLEKIPLAQINNNADENDANSDGISGRINWIGDGGIPLQQGRFGWKAGQVSLAVQTARALNLDIGISSALYPNAYGDCTVTQTNCLESANGNSPNHDNLEASNVLMQYLLFFINNVPAPFSPNDDADYKQGQRLFVQAGCATCHTQQFEVQGESIKPYSDLLLHDMGEALADTFTEASASEKEWRTPPLWGLGARSYEEYLHDGRAKNLTEAILWHGGEAESAKERFKSMPREERDDLIRFLNEL